MACCKVLGAIVRGDHHRAFDLTKDSINPHPCRLIDLNDAFRKAGPVSGQWMLTRGVADPGAVFVALATQAIRSYDRFRAEDDPYAERDFGSFDLAGQKLFWTIDY